MASNYEALDRICSHRTSIRWLRIAMPAMLGVLVVGASCNHTSEPGIADQVVPATSEDRSPATAQQQAADPPSPDDRSSPFVEQELEQLDSPFTKETVLELNAIVSRSLSAIEEFDEARKHLEIDNNESVAETLQLYTGLSTKAEQARVDMDAASERLRSSGEKYNKAIFAAMVRFVDNVDNEIREEIEELRKHPHGNEEE